jgi:hypothetical protein
VASIKSRKKQLFLYYTAHNFVFVFRGRGAK